MHATSCQCARQRRSTTARAPPLSLRLSSHPNLKLPTKHAKSVSSTRFLVLAQRLAALASVALSDCKINIQVREYRIRHEDKRDDMVIVTSEPLTDVKADWIPVPHNHLLVVTSLRQVLLAPVVIKDDLQAVSSSALPSGPDLAASDLHQVNPGEVSQISRLR